MVKKLQDYIMATKQRHEYMVRIAVENFEPSKKQLSRMEANLKKYELVSVSKPRQTIFQAHAYGFAEATHCEITYFTITTELTVSCFYLAREIAKCFGITENRVLVYDASHGEPVPEESEEIVTLPELDDSCYGKKFVDDFLQAMKSNKPMDTHVRKLS